MKFRLNITPKLSLIFMLFAALLLTVVSTLAYTSGRAALESATVAELFSVAIEKQAALNAWITETESHVSAISASPNLQNNAAALLTARASEDQVEIRAAHDRIIAELQVWAGAGRDYLGWMILDPQTGQIIAATDPGEEGKFRENQPFFINGKNGPYLQNLYYSPSTQGALLTVSAPIRSDAGELLGVLAGNLDLENMNIIILRRTGLRQSDDAFLVNTSNLFVTQPRLLNDPTLLQAGVHTEAVNRCLERNSGTVTAPDYRGVPSMIVYRWLPERQLCLIVKMDQAEALAPVLVLRTRIFLISILALMVAGALAYGLARTITRPVLQLVKAAEEIGAGELQPRIEVPTGDEIEALAEAFVQMAEDLQKTLVSRDDLLAEVAERKQVETALRDSQAQVTGIFNSAMDAILTVDEKQKIIIFNPSAEQMFGCPASQAIGQTLDRFLPDYVRKSHRKYLRGFGQSNSTKRSMKTPALALTCLRADGELFPSEVSISQLEIGGKKLYTAIVRDITERKQAEQALQEYNTRLETEVEKRTRELRDAQEQLVRQERLATLGQVAGSIGHELRNPLGVISNAVYYLKMSQPDVNDTVKEYLDIIASEARSSDKIVTDLLDFTRAKSVDRETVIVADVVRQTLERFPVPPTVEVVLDLPADLPSLHADPHHVGQVLGNLVVNACQAMPTGGKLTVSASLDGDMIKLAVRDTGSGISSENMAKLFEPLFTTKTKGIGLGLAVSRKLVEINGGRIEVQSEPGQGSTFIIFLPVYGS